MAGKRSLRRATFVFPIALVALLMASPTGAETNYILKPVPPKYIEANTVLRDPTTGDVFRGDDAWLEIPLPFPFTFYGVTYGPDIEGQDKVYVSTNGYINFREGNSFFSNVCIRDEAADGTILSAPDSAIYAFWDDLNVDDSASVLTELLDTAPNRQFVIEWRNVTFFADYTKRVDFEIVLHETGAILLQYRNIDSDGLETGNSATIGLENQTGTEVAQFSCYTDSAAIGPIGVGEFALGFSQPASSVTVPVDIKPGGCPNPLNVGSKGVLPVAVLGTKDFDVTTINPATVKLEGVPALRWSLEDVGTADERFLGKTDAYECNTLGPDGYLDLVFKFDTQAVAAALGEVGDKEVRTLQVSGELMDGMDPTKIHGEDVVIILKGGKEK